MTKIELKAPTSNKNADGRLGPICNNCAGYGFTLSISGRGDSGCNHCGQTGIARLDNEQLSARVANLELEIRGLKNLIVKELGKAG